MGQQTNKADVQWRGPQSGSVARLLSLAGPYRGRLVVATAVLIGASGIALWYPQAARVAVDIAIDGDSLAELNPLVAVFVGALVVHGALIWLRHYLMSWLGERVVADLRTTILDRLVMLPMGWFHERRTGDLAGRLASDVTLVQTVIGSELSVAMRNLVQGAGGVVLLYLVSPKLALTMLVIVPPLALAVVTLGGQIRARSARLQDRLAEASGQVQETLTGMRTVQAFSRERHESGRYAGKVERSFEEALTLARWRASFFAAIALSTYVAVAAMLWFGIQEVSRGALSVGDVTAFLMYSTTVAVAVGSTAEVWGSIMRGAGATDRLFEIAEETSDIQDPARPVELPEGGGTIRFEEVRFHYATRPGQEVLLDVSLEVKAGERLAIVGASGAGKTTLSSLVMRFYDPVAGRVLLEGVDLRALRLGDVRSAVSVVDQDPFIFSGTIRENLLYGNPEADDATLDAAVRDASAMDFIDALADGYETVVGEHGVKLSGGQRQRIAIARALLRGGRILILDEATSNLDAANEAAIQAAMWRLTQGRTTLIIAHRLSTVRNADRIVVLERGRIVEIGAHEELVSAGGTYQHLLEHQVVA